MSRAATDNGFETIPSNIYVVKKYVIFPVRGCEGGP